MNIVPTKGFKEDKIFLSSNHNGNNSGGEEKLDNPLEMPSTTGHIASKSMVIESVKIKNGRWTKDEHFRFLEALKLYGKEWKRVQEHVCTRTSTQARSHAQKFFNKLEKRKQSLTDFLETLDLNDMEKHYIMSDLDDEKVNHAYIGKNKAHPKRKLNETQGDSAMDPEIKLADKIQVSPQLLPLENVEPKSGNTLQADQNSPTDLNILSQRSKSKRRAAGSNINYAIFDKTGCIPKSDAQPNLNSAIEGDDQASITTDQIINGAPDHQQGGSLLKKRAHAMNMNMNPNDNENDNEFQPPLPKGTVERTSSQKIMNGNGYQKFQKLDKACKVPQQLFNQVNKNEVNDPQNISSVTQTTQNSMISNQTILQQQDQLQNFNQPHQIRQQHSVPTFTDSAIMGLAANGIVVNNIGFPMTPNLRHSSSVYQGNRANSILDESQISMFSQMSDQVVVHRKSKKQRANSYEYFGQNILDKEDDNDSDLEPEDNEQIHVYKRPDRAETLDMIQIVNGQLPQALIPPTQLHLSSLNMNGRNDQIVNKREMITPKQKYSVYNLLPPTMGGESAAFDGLERMRCTHMRRPSQDLHEGTDAADFNNTLRESLAPTIDQFDTIQPASIQHGNLLTGLPTNFQYDPIMAANVSQKIKNHLSQFNLMDPQMGTNLQSALLNASHNISGFSGGLSGLGNQLPLQIGQNMNFNQNLIPDLYQGLNQAMYMNNLGSQAQFQSPQYAAPSEEKKGQFMNDDL